MNRRHFSRPPHREIDVRRVRRRTVILSAIALAVGAGANVALADPPEDCDVRLVVELTPDVPNPRDVGFLGSLLGDNVSYELTLRRERDDSDIVLELTGPGPYYRCQDVIEAIRRDGRVLSVHVRQNAS